MKAWQDGTRKTDPSQQMPSIAKALSPRELQAVVAYYSALPPPPASISVAPRTAPSARGAGAASGPR